MGVILSDADYVSRSRGAAKDYYVIITPENQVQYSLPFFEKTEVRVLATPRTAGFGQYLFEMESGAHTSRPVKPGLEHFIYQVDGEVVLSIDGQANRLPPGGFAYLPDEATFELKNDSAGLARTLWIKRVYEKVEGLAPPALRVSHRDEVDLEETTVARSWCRALLPLDDVSFDFAMNLLSFDPGVYFDQVEIHHQEHGLYMTKGKGIYYLAGDFHEVQKDDFIYMAPYCPQFFYAMGWSEGEYLLYKDMNRDGF
jgi:(S)-ureidoglycine aminohydrolase